jgi:hypothetical protein
MADKQIPSLDGLIQPKGAARPDSVPQRAEAEGPARALQAALHSALPAAAPAMPLERQSRAKSLTLRLSEGHYERLRRFAFERRLSHQEIIERGLLEYLDRQDRP